MFIVFGIMIVGIVAGYTLRTVIGRRVIERMITVVICLLLFFLGLSVGANKMILNNLSSIGWQALVLTLGAVIGSVLMAWGVYEKFFKKEQKSRQREQEVGDEE